MDPKQILLLWVRMNLRVMAMKGYFTFPDSELEPHHCIQFNVITKAPHFCGNLTFLLRIQSKGWKTSLKPCFKLWKAEQLYFFKVLYAFKFLMRKWIFRLGNKKYPGKFVCLSVRVLWDINFCRVFNAKFIFIQTNSSISNNSV